MTAPTIVVPGATATLCRRSNLRKAFLAPWHEDVMGIWLYSLALAQQKTNVAIHQTTLVLNHHHTEVTSSAANLPDFKRILHGDTMRLMDAEAQAAHIVYGHVNTVAAGLVRTPSDMPGWTFDFGLWKGGTILVRRPPGYFDPDIHPEWLPLTFTPSPELYLAFAGDLDAIVHHMRKLTEGAVRALRDARKGRPVLSPTLFDWRAPALVRDGHRLIFRSAQAEHLGPIARPGRASRTDRRGPHRASSSTSSAGRRSRHEITPPSGRGQASTYSRPRRNPKSGPHTPAQAEHLGPIARPPHPGRAPRTDRSAPLCA